MLKPERMSKLFVVAPKSKLGSIVSKLHDLKVAHIIEHRKDEFDLCDPQESFEKVSSLLVQVRSLTSHLKNPADKTQPSNFKISDIEKNVSSIKGEVTKIIEDSKITEDEISLISEQKKILKLMACLDISPEDFQDSRYLKAYIGHIKDSNIKEKLEKITDRFDIYTARDDKKTLVAIFVDISYQENFDKVLLEASFSDIDTSSTRDLKGDAEDLFRKIVFKNEKLVIELKAKKDKFEKIISNHSDYLIDIEKFLSIEADKSQIPLSFGATREAFFMRCYLPSADVEKSKEEITKASGNRIYIEEEELGDEDEVPIKLQNSDYVKNFEFFTKLFALPKYKEYDPSFLMAYTFPIFMGFMLGDVAYGIIIAVLFPSSNLFFFLSSN